MSIILENCVAYVVLFTELLGKGRAHDLATLSRGGGEVSLSALTARRANVYNCLEKLKMSDINVYS